MGSLPYTWRVEASFPPCSKDLVWKRWEGGAGGEETLSLPLRRDSLAGIPESRSIRFEDFFSSFVMEGTVGQGEKKERLP